MKALKKSHSCHKQRLKCPLPTSSALYVVRLLGLPGHLSPHRMPPPWLFMIHWFKSAQKRWRPSSVLTPAALKRVKEE